MKNLENFHKKCKEKIKKEMLIYKLYFSACIVLGDHLDNENDNILYDELIDLIDFNEKGTIYRAAYDNNIELIMNLNKKSFLYPFLLQFDSCFKINQQKYKNKFEKDSINTCMISMLTLEQLKIDLINSLDKNYGIRIFFNTEFYGNKILATLITTYNEKKLFGKKLGNEELLFKNDINYIFTNT